MLTCQELVELVTDYLDGALPPVAHAELESHLERCPPCRRYLDQMRVTHRRLEGVPPQTLSPEVCGELVDAFRRIRPMTSR